MAGWAGYGYCASHSRFYWGLKLYLVCTPTGMPILWALADPKGSERQVLSAILDVDAAVAGEHEGILLICDKGFAGREFETLMGEYGITMLQPSRKDEKARYGELLLKKVRQLIESVNDTLKVQLDLETTADARSGCRDPRRPARVGDGAAIWHNHTTGALVTRSLIAYDH
nr:transposase [Nocardia sienata]